jgi:uncharacterized membrane protein YphA (DoxX/SURF4 family)
MTDFHLLSLFPALLTYQLWAPTAFRLALGIIFASFGYNKITKQRNEKAAFFEAVYLKPGKTFVWIIGTLEIVAGIMLIFGMLTQGAALFTSIILAAALVLKKKHPSAIGSDSGFLALLLLISLSLLITGPGQQAIDLPL